MNANLREVLSQVKVPNKGVNADSRITGRYIYSLLKKHRDWLLKQIDSKYYLYNLSYLFQTIKCVDVIPVPTIDECCGIKSACKIYRTKERLPDILNSYYGPIIRKVTSIDNSTRMQNTTALEWNRKTENPDMINFDKSSYYYWEDGYLYLPNANWKKVKVEAYFNDDVSRFDKCTPENACISILDKPFRLPNDLMAQCVENVNKELMIYQQIPDDVQNDKNPNRKGNP